MKTFDKEYKIMAVNRVKESGKPVSEVVFLSTENSPAILIENSPT